MDKLTHYRKVIQEILTEHSQVQPAFGEVHMKLMLDRDRHRYQLLRTGWQDERRVYHSPFIRQYDGFAIN